MILKCKMCGGDIQISSDTTIGTCEYCGSTMTIPHIDSDKKARLFNRAIQYGINCEFDKAYEVYKTIADEDDQEPEAYWGMILSEYGIEYVDDPKTGKKIPTCHRVNKDTIRSTINYEYAIKYADAEQKFVYQDEAEAIDNIRKIILAISDKVEPYDVFVCYKETEDETGERTQDSVLAYDLYEDLERHNIKTFFARVSLEDILGQNYEPYIFSALQSAKVMIILTTSREHAEAVWVKNEWSRFIKLMNEDADKVIIPVYKDMSAYELPDALASYQAQDLSKPGAQQDIVRAIGKIVGESHKGVEKATKKYRKAIIITFAIVVFIALLIVGFLNLWRLDKIETIEQNSQVSDVEIEADNTLAATDETPLDSSTLYASGDNRWWRIYDDGYASYGDLDRVYIERIEYSELSNASYQMEIGTVIANIEIQNGKINVTADSRFVSEWTGVFTLIEESTLFDEVNEDVSGFIGKWSNGSKSWEFKESGEAVYISEYGSVVNTSYKKTRDGISIKYGTITINASIKSEASICVNQEGTSDFAGEATGYFYRG